MKTEVKLNTSYGKKFARYAFLSVLGTLGVSCYILADTFFVAKGLGTSGLAALNIAIPVYNFIHGIGLMLGMGGGTRFSICKSGGGKDRIDKIFTNTVYAGLFFGIFFAAVGLLFSGWLAQLLGADAEIVDMTKTYLKWLMLFAPAFIMNDILLCFVRNDDQPFLSTVAMLVGSFSNIILDYIFIFPLDMGIFGAVFATGLSPIISILLMSPHWLKKRNSFHLVKTALEPEIVGQDISLGFSSLIAQLASGVAMIIFNMLILGLEGNVGVAAYGVIANISLVVVAIYTGIAQGAQPLISDSYGAGHKQEIQLGLRYALGSMAVLSAVLYLIIFVFSDSITTIFNSERDVQMQALSVTGLKLYFTSNLFVGFNTILAIYFTSIERAWPAHVLSLLRGLVLLAPLAFFLSALWEMTGIWLTYPVTEGLVAVMGYLWYRKLVRSL